MCQKRLCHRAEVAKISVVATTDCVFCNVIGGGKILHRKQSMLMKPEGSVKCHQTPPTTASSSGTAPYHGFFVGHSPPPRLLRRAWPHTTASSSGMTPHHHGPPPWPPTTAPHHSPPPSTHSFNVSQGLL